MLVVYGFSLLVAGEIPLVSTVARGNTFPMRIHVHVPSQTLDLLDDAGEVIRRYVISTSKYGLGTEPGSNRTPTGSFRIYEKVGDGAEPGMIFKSRVPTGQFGNPEDPDDWVQTRILWLDGTDPDNTNTRDR